MLSRRRFLRISSVAAAASVATFSSAGQQPRPPQSTPRGPVPPAIANIPAFTGKVQPFTNDERLVRVERARRLMSQHKMDAIVLANSTTNTMYFANVRTGGSERLWAIIIPAKGKPFVVCPAFERARAEESLAEGPFGAGADVLTWQEDESPFALLAKGLKDRGLATGTVGLDENMKFIFANSLAKAAPGVRFVSAVPVTAGCRAIKDAHELECLRVAGAATLAVYEAVYKSLQAGMTTNDVRGLVQLAYAKTGLMGEASLNIDEFTASPHGSRKPQTIREGSILIMDDGCVVEGYTSDITRTFVLGTPTDKMRKVFNTVRDAQTAALKAARPGLTMSEVDRAARKVISDAGYGPGFKYFTHRVGHGIGMDMHEWPYLVDNNMWGDELHPRLEANMTFSDEPGIYIPGEFGVRLEDELHITAEGAELLTPQSNSLDHPFGH